MMMKENSGLSGGLIHVKECINFLHKLKAFSTFNQKKALFVSRTFLGVSSQKSYFKYHQLF